MKEINQTARMNSILKIVKEIAENPATFELKETLLIVVTTV